MYHERFRGAHYEIGYRYGASLLKHGQRLLEHVPFPVTQERRNFAQACIPVYQELFPEILEEIRGLADGQHCDCGELQAVLLSMYAIPPACGCSCFAAVNDAHIFLGRNSDFLPALEKLNTNAIYKFTNDAYSFTGNTTAFIEVEDGVNEYGLAAGLTSVYPIAVKPGFNAGMLLRFFLEKCRTVEEAVRSIRRLPISSAQTVTVADAGGNIAVIECNAKKTAVVSPSKEHPFVCATNVFHAEEMLALQDLAVDNCRSEQRYRTLTRALDGAGGRVDPSFAKGLLSGKNGFLCQYDRADGTDTVWSVLYDLKEKAIYRAEGNPGRKKFVKDERFSIR
ncbi:MAG: acyl-CoA--6-aminopenicillanic acid acyltransferase [Subdoligranulum sp.]|nr:acyl-CoA--6-aminopenicillanic acid acyltransferase [Subdoligranulum sp.]